MSDCMTFPATFDEFANQYHIIDKKEVYTNGTELIPVFRVKQWLDHLPSENASKAALLSEVELRFVDFLGTYTSESTMRVDDVFRLLSLIKNEILEGAI